MNWLVEMPYVEPWASRSDYLGNAILRLPNWIEHSNRLSMRGFELTVFDHVILCLSCHVEASWQRPVPMDEESWS